MIFFLNTFFSIYLNTNFFVLLRKTIALNRQPFGAERQNSIWSVSWCCNCICDRMQHSIGYIEHPLRWSNWSAERSFSLNAVRWPWTRPGFEDGQPLIAGRSFDRSGIWSALTQGGFSGSDCAAHGATSYKHGTLYCRIGSPPEAKFWIRTQMKFCQDTEIVEFDLLKKKRSRLLHDQYVQKVLCVTLARLFVTVRRIATHKRGQLGLLGFDADSLRLSRLFSLDRHQTL